MAKEYWDWNWPGPVAELYALIRRGRRALKNISAPTFTLVAREDTAVPVSVIELVRQRLGTSNHRELILEKSGHMFMREGEMELVYRELFVWLEGL
jgi:esterase/lipase